MPACRYIISYELYNFKGHLDDYPLTMAYGRQMDALRTELREYFWDGEYRDVIGATVTTAEGQPHHPYAVYLHCNTGQPGLVLANYDEHAAVTLHVALDSGQPLARYRLVDAPEWHSTADGIVLPPQSAAVAIP